MSGERGADPQERAARRAPAEAGTGPRVVGLKQRREFLATAAGRRWVAPAFVLQAAPRPMAGGNDAPEVGLGFTASRRVGKAVARNRARRRLREAARAVLPGPAQPGYNYVIVARPAALTCPFTRLVEDLSTALARITRTGGRRTRATSPDPAGRSGS